MKKIINWFLLIGTIISTGIAIKYSAIPVLSFLPDNIAEFWITTTEEQQQYVLIYDLAVGFIMSSLFYFVVEEIPSYVRIRKAKLLLNPHINQLVEKMEQLISAVIAQYGCNTNLKMLAQKDFLQLDGEKEIAKQEISYLTTTYYKKTNKKKTAVRAPSTIGTLVKNNLRAILREIEKIKNYEYFYATDENLVECIRNIEGCKLVRFYLKDNGNSQENTPCFIMHGTSTAMAEFVQFYLQLIKLKYHTEYSITEMDTEEETIKYRNDRESGILLQGVLEKQKEHRNLAVANPTVLVHGEKYTSKIIAREITSKIIALQQTINEAKEKDLTGFKYVVLVIDTLSSKEMVNLIHEAKLPTNIILLTEQKLYFKKYAQKLRNNNVNVITELYFKNAVEICSMQVNKEEPSEKSIAEMTRKIEDIVYGKHY